MRRISFFLFVLILAVSVTLPAFAAVQNVKVGGDVTVRHLWRRAFDLNADNNSDTYNGALFGPIDGDAAAEPRRLDDVYNWFMEQVRLRVDAELTDNISGRIELLNQRDMDGPNVGTQGSALATNGGGTAVHGLVTGAAGAPSGANDAFDITLNQAVITVKEFLYGPVTLSVGRQNYQMGDGFVIGSSQIGQPDLQNSLAADEFTMSHAFDSLLLTVDLDPWAIDFFTAKVSEDNILANDDETLLAINVGRTFETWKSEVETYYVVDRNASTVDGAGTTLSRTAAIHAWGVRGTTAPIEHLRLNTEAVMQFGKEGGLGTALTNGAGTNAGADVADFTYNGNQRQDIRAFASDLRAEYDITQLPWPSTVGMEHVFYSGEDANEDGNSANYRPLYRGKFHSAIREFQGSLYIPSLGVTPGGTNQHQFILDIGFNPFNNPDIKFFTRFLSFWFHHVPVGDVTPAVAGDNSGGRRRHIGEELDFQLSWAYTEDLTFDMIYAMFVPGSYFEGGANILSLGSPAAGIVEAKDVAQELVTSVSLNFG
ncbi:MAG: alginate export family protein [Candidatus Omnitrophica bacterium]|nr:alginate export family protein [Candidatus Omnitrophota bacterium]